MQDLWIANSVDRTYLIRTRADCKTNLSFAWPCHRNLTRKERFESFSLYLNENHTFSRQRASELKTRPSHMATSSSRTSQKQGYRKKSKQRKKERKHHDSMVTKKQRKGYRAIDHQTVVKESHHCQFPLAQPCTIA